MDKQEFDILCESETHRLIASPDRKAYSLLLDNGWDFVQIASATAHQEGDTTVYNVRVLADPPVCVPAENVAEALWALTIPEPA